MDSNDANKYKIYNLEKIKIEKNAHIFCDVSKHLFTNFKSNKICRYSGNSQYKNNFAILTKLKSLRLALFYQYVTATRFQIMSIHKQEY